MSIDPKFVELTADVLKIFLYSIYDGSFFRGQGFGQEFFLSRPQYGILGT